MSFSEAKGGGSDLWKSDAAADPSEAIDGMLASEVEGSPADRLAAKYMNEFSIYEAARIYHDDQMIKALRNYHGMYGPEVKLNKNESQAFVKLTKTKVKLSIAMIAGVLMAPDSWGIESTREPSMPKLKAQMMKAQMPPELIRKKVKEAADLAAERLLAKVEDTLLENDFESIETRGLLDFCLFGKAIVYGPMAYRLDSHESKANNPTSALSWLASKLGWKDESAELLQLQQAGLEETYGYKIELVRPWDIYFDPISEKVEECSSIFRRRVMTRSQMRELLQDPLFDSEAILKLLEENPDGNWSVKPWEASIAAIDRRNTLMGTGANGRFVVYERWGKISGRELKDAGIEVETKDLERETMAQIWICGNKIIKCESSKLHADRLPFYIAQYDVVPGTMHAEGVAESMFDAQATINAAEREKNNNMAAISRPNVIVRPDRLKMRDTVIEFKPGKVWTVKEGDDSQVGKPVDFFDVPNHLESFLKVQASAKQWAQEETGLPDFLQGMNGPGTHNRTEGGAVLQFQNSMAPLRTVILNWEKQLRVPLFQCIARAYDMFSKDPSIKGDCRVVARGVQRMMAREAFITKIQEILQAISTIPGLAKRLDEEAIGNSIFQNLGISHETFFLDEKTFQEKMQAEAKAEAQKAGMNADANGSGHRFKVETARRDALLQLASDAKGTVVFPWVLEENMQAQDAITSQEMQNAFNLMKAEAMRTHQSNMVGATENGAPQAGGQGFPNQTPVAPAIGQQIQRTKTTHGPDGEVQSVEHHTETPVPFHAPMPEPPPQPPQLP